MQACLAALVAALGAVEAPVTEVTVFTDQARVVRTARVKVAGTTTVELPPLRDTIDITSVRVEATGAEVTRVDIGRLEREALRTTEAKALITELDKVDTDIARLSGERATVQTQVGQLSRLSPTVPKGDPLKPLPRLNGSGWMQAARFPVDRLEGLMARLRTANLQLEKLQEKRQKLAEEARKVGEPSEDPGWKVTAQLSGKGDATVRLSYLVRQARWTPSWDLQLDPDTNKVGLSLGGLVSQESGEDWEKAQLVLSTAVPSAAVQVPKLLTWKIGTVDRFIPTPTPVADLIAPPPPALGVPRFSTEEDVLRATLMRMAQGPATAEGLLGATEVTRSAELAPAYGGPAGAAAQAQGDYRRAELERRKQEYYAKRKAMEPPPPPPRAPSRPMPSAQAPAAMPMEEAESVDSDDFAFGGAEVTGTLTVAEGSRGGRYQPVAQMSLSAPPGYRPPRYGPTSPVTLAQGYDLAFTSLQRETVPSARGTRRVALWSQAWPVTVERKVFPALAPEAFLVAELKNPSKQVLPGGPAQLYVGADPAGKANLKLVSPGESFTLPLGIDRALRPQRNVTLTEKIEGFISKDEVTTYTVTTELNNPYRVPVAVRIYDQLPVTDQKDLEVKLTGSTPQAIQDQKNGWLEWRLTLPAQKKSTVSFTYTLRRPRGWKLYQQEVRP